MANSARDPYWQASVRRETIDHPESRAVIEDECSICHMPMARYESKRQGKEGEVFSHLGFDPDKPGDKLAADGVSCSLCHQISKEKLGTRESFVGGFQIDPPNADGQRPEYGPFKIEAGQTRIMRTSSRGFRPTEAEHIRQSEVCATCHTLYTKRWDRMGKVIGELPEQMPYQEWLHSEFQGEERELPVLPHAGGEGRRADHERVGRASRRILAARVRGEQLLHAADAEPLSRRAQGGGAAAGAGGGGGSHGRASADADRANRHQPRGLARGASRGGGVGREPGRPQAADGVSLTPRLAARGRAGPEQADRV